MSERMEGAPRFFSALEQNMDQHIGHRLLGLWLGTLAFCVLGTIAWVALLALTNLLIHPLIAIVIFGTAGAAMGWTYPKPIKRMADIIFALWPF